MRKRGIEPQLGGFLKVSPWPQSLGSKLGASTVVTPLEEDCGLLLSRNKQAQRGCAWKIKTTSITQG